VFSEQEEIEDDEEKSNKKLSENLRINRAKMKNRQNWRKPRI